MYNSKAMCTTQISHNASELTRKADLDFFFLAEIQVTIL